MRSLAEKVAEDIDHADHAYACCPMVPDATFIVCRLLRVRESRRL